MTGLFFEILRGWQVAAMAHVFLIRLIVHSAVLTPFRGMIRLVHVINPAAKGFRDIKVLCVIPALPRHFKK